MPEAAARVLSGPPGLPDAALASASSNRAPTAFTQRGKSGLFVMSQKDHLFARKIEPGPATPEAAVDLGPHGDLGSLSVKPLGEGFVVFRDERVDENHVFSIQTLDAAGHPAGKLLLLRPIADAGVTYADLALVSGGGLVVHEVQNRGRSSVFVTPLAADLGSAAGVPRPVAEGVLAWDLTVAGDKLAFAFVRADASAAAPKTAVGGAPTPGTVDVITVAKDGTASAPIVVQPLSTAEIDVEIAAVRGALLVAWTDAEGDDAAVRLAAVRDGALVAPPKFVAPPVGDQALIGLTSDPLGDGARALIAWENIGQTTEESRIAHLATVGADATLGKERTRLLIGPQDRPDLVADGDGFAALTLAPARALTVTETSPAPSWPIVVRFGADLAVRGAEPVRLASARSHDGVPDLAFGLGCHADACLALAADSGPPVSYFAFEVPARDTAWRAPAWRADDERPPRVLSLRTITEGPQIAAARSFTTQGAAGPASDPAAASAPTLVAWVTYFLEGVTPLEAAPKGESPYAATLALRSVGPDGISDESVIVSKRALSTGGVAIAGPAALAGAGAAKSEAVIAWVAADKTGPQVYVTKVDARGKKLAQKRLTTVDRPKKTAAVAEGVASNVALAWSPAPTPKKGEARVGTDGYVVAWVDGREGNGEVYAARVNRELEKVVVDKRLTSASGDASDVSVLAVGSDAFVAFADRRDGKDPDIYLSHLDAGTLRVLDSDIRVYASAGPSRAPQLISVGGSLLLAWIEEPAPGETMSSTLRLAEVDATGRLVGAPKVLRAPEGAAVTAFSLTCETEKRTSCRGVISWVRSAGRPEAGGFLLDEAGAPGPISRLGSLSSGPFADPSFSFADAGARSLYFTEDTAGERGRIRAIRLAW